MDYGKHLILSTAHVTHKTSETLTGWASLPAELQPLVVASTWYGWFVSTFEVEGEPARSIPAELADIQRFARGLGCDYVLLDCDAETVGELPTFSW